MTQRITIEKLAMMIQTGFNEMYERFVTKEELKEDLYELEERMISKINKMATKEDLRDMEERLLNRWGNEIDRLKDDMRLVKTKLKLS